MPVTPETLWLRGLGKDKILTQAFANISELPPTRRERNDILEVCIKHFKYLSEKSATGLTQTEDDFMKTMQEIDALYKAEMSRARLEGEERGEQLGRELGEQLGRQFGKMREQTLILRLLKRRLGNVSNDLEAQIGSLPLDRLEELGEALFDFTRMSNLIGWLDKNI